MIKLFNVWMPKDVVGPLLEVLYSGYITQGAKVDEFEKALAYKVGNSKVLSLNSGTSALTLALRLANIGPGDEVISTPMTCIATNVPIVTAGAKIRWADVDPDTGLIDPENVDRKLTAKTKAIVAVDWGGLPCDYDTLREVANGIPLISDAAHSFGGRYKGVRIGAVADFTAFSFQAIKTITTVDGGALTTRLYEDYERGKLLRWFGVDRENDTQFKGSLDVVEAGYKFHMNDVTAVIGLVQLQQMHTPLEHQRAGATRYQAGLSSFYEIPAVDYPVVSASWLMTVLLPDRQRRDTFVSWMESQSIECSQVHWRNDWHTAFKDFYDPHLPGVDRFTDRMVCIPNHWALTPQERTYIIKKMNEFAS